MTRPRKEHYGINDRILYQIGRRQALGTLNQL